MAGKRTPKWVADKVEQSRRAARAEACPKCGHDVMVGQSDDAQFWTARVDPLPVDPVAEAVARARGLMSYDAVLKNGRRETHLYARAVEHMRRAASFPVLLDHVCGDPIPRTTTTETIHEQEGLFNV